VAKQASLLDELLDLRKGPWFLAEELVAGKQKDLQAVA
jgi:hypothetical protein